MIIERGLPSKQSVAIFAGVAVYLGWRFYRSCTTVECKKVQEWMEEFSAALPTFVKQLEANKSWYEQQNSNVYDVDLSEKILSSISHHFNRFDDLKNGFYKEVLCESEEANKLRNTVESIRAQLTPLESLCFELNRLCNQKAYSNNNTALALAGTEIPASIRGFKDGMHVLLEGLSK